LTQKISDNLSIQTGNQEVLKDIEILKGKLELRYQTTDQDYQDYLDNQKLFNQLKTLEQSRSDIHKDQDLLEYQLQDHDPVTIQENERIIAERNSLEKEYQNLDGQTKLSNKLRTCLDKTRYKILDLEKDIKTHETATLNLEYNQDIDRSISKLTWSNQTLQSDIQNEQRDIVGWQKDIEHLSGQISDLNEQWTQYQDLESRVKILELYLKAMSRDGIPMKMIRHQLPSLENRTNQILSSLGPYRIQLEYNIDVIKRGGKEIIEEHFYMDFQKDGVSRRSTSMGGGCERFFIEIAFRIALKNILSIRNANFLIIDEGFGCLDQDNLERMSNFFDFLSKNFFYVLIITHVDQLKNLIPQRIPLSKNGQFTTICQNPVRRKIVIKKK
jgi:DNA repair exonuclease SbcCD ATPase subunit